MGFGPGDGKGETECTLYLREEFIRSARRAQFETIKAAFMTIWKTSVKVWGEPVWTVDCVRSCIQGGNINERHSEVRSDTVASLPTLPIPPVLDRRPEVARSAA